MTLALFWLIYFFNHADRQVLFSVFPLLKHDLGLGDAQLGLLGSCFQWVFALLVPVAGALSDSVRRKNLIVAALLAWSVRTFASGVVTGFALLALVLGGRVVPVHGADMVAVGAVFGGEFPVAFVDVAGRTAQYFQAIRRLVDDHVDDLRRFAQVLDQWQYIGFQAAEQEAAIGLETRNTGQVVGAFAVEARRVAGVGRVLDLEQLAGVVESPAVERTGVGALVAGLVPAQGRAAMAAGIEEGVEHTVLVARNEDRLAPHGGGVEIVNVGDLTFVSQIQPVAFKDVLHLQVEQAWISEHLALAAIDALFGIVFKQGVKVFGSQGHGRRLHCYCSDKTHARTGQWGELSAGLQTCIRFVQEVMESGTTAPSSVGQCRRLRV